MAVLSFVGLICQTHNAVSCYDSSVCMWLSYLSNRIYVTQFVLAILKNANISYMSFLAVRFDNLYFTRNGSVKSITEVITK